MGLSIALALIILTAQAESWDWLEACPSYSVSSVTGWTHVKTRRLPLEFEVLPGRRLHVDGLEIRRVALTLSEDGQLELSGAALGVDPWDEILRGPAQWDEEDGDILARFGGDRLFERERAAGATLEEAARATERARGWATGKLLWEYSIARDSGETEERAREIAFEVLRGADSDSLVDWGAMQLPGSDYVCMRWREPERGHIRSALPLELNRRRIDCGALADTDACRVAAYATHLCYYLSESPDTCWVFIRSSGNAEVMLDGVSRAGVADQLAHARETGHFGVYPLAQDMVRRILHADASAHRE